MYCSCSTLSVVMFCVLVCPSDAGAAAWVRFGHAATLSCALYNAVGLPMAAFAMQVKNDNSLALARGQDTHAARSAVVRPPPMGFNSWNFYHCNINENTVW